MRKLKCMLLALSVLVLAIIAGIWCYNRYVKTDEPTTDFVEIERDEIELKSTLNESLDGAKGHVILYVEDELPLLMSDIETCLGSDALESIVIDGSGTGSIVVTGDVRSSIRLTNAGATLTFKNLTFSDEYTGAISYITDYTHFAGSMYFDDCTFTHGIRIRENANMTFKGCTFVSPQADRYGAWVEDGKATFEDCTFKGFRGLKVHEDPKTPTDDITTVTVDGCTFDNLSVKCGIAIGTVNANTTLKVVNSLFDNCQAWDTVGSLDGVNGIYETDTPTADYTLILENNEVKGDYPEDDNENWTQNY